VQQEGGVEADTHGRHSLSSGARLAARQLNRRSAATCCTQCICWTLYISIGRNVRVPSYH
jgi:hypothetical protein